MAWLGLGAAGGAVLSGAGLAARGAVRAVRGSDNTYLQRLRNTNLGDETGSVGGSGGKGAGGFSDMDDFARRFFNAKGGGKELLSPGDAFANRDLLVGKTPAEVEQALKGTPGWQVERPDFGQHGKGWALRDTSNGDTIRWHPGGDHTGSEPYWELQGQFGTDDPIRPAETR